MFRTTALVAMFLAAFFAGPAHPDVSPRERIVKLLDAPVSVEFEQVHLSEVLDFLAEAYDVNIIIDNRAVAPAPRSNRTALGGVAYATDGMIPYINLKNVAMHQALSAILHPLGLTYSVQSNFIWISTPKNIGQETFENFETRTYSLPRRVLPNVNADRPGARLDGVDIVELLGKLIPEFIDPVSGDAITYMRFNEVTRQLVVHNTPTSLDRIERLLEALLPDATFE